jgi:hypothetical protein
MGTLWQSKHCCMNDNHYKKAFETTYLGKENHGTLTMEHCVMIKIRKM